MFLFMKQNTLRHSLLLLLTAAIWGFAFVAQSVGMDYVQPFTFTAARSLIGGIVLLPFIFIRAQKAGRTSEEKSASWKQALPGGIICGVLLCIASNLQQIGIQYTTVGKRGFITAMYIVLVPVLDIFFHKKTGIRVWISVALAVCGLYLLCMIGGSFRLQRGDQRGGNCTQKETKGGKNDEKKTNENGRYCRYRGGCTGTCLHCSTDIFCGAAKKDVSGVLGTAK
jgi:drug/metabolite transporter (DMT)-like permease